MSTIRYYATNGLLGTLFNEFCIIIWVNSALNSHGILYLSVLEFSLVHTANLNVRPMKSNMGNIDRIIRVVLGLALGAAYFLGWVSGTAGYVVLALGVIFLVTSAINFCPLYAVLGINTCPVKQE